jgi:hypothetical protein
MSGSPVREPPGLTSYNTSRNLMYKVPELNLNSSLPQSVKEYKKILAQLEAAVARADEIDRQIKSGNQKLSIASAMYADRMVNQKRIQVSRLQSDPNVKEYIRRRHTETTSERSVPIERTTNGPSTIFKKRRSLRKTRRASRRNTTRRRR